MNFVQITPQHKDAHYTISRSASRTVAHMGPQGDTDLMNQCGRLVLEFFWWPSPHTWWVIKILYFFGSKKNRFKEFSKFLQLVCYRAPIRAQRKWILPLTIARKESRLPVLVFTECVFRPNESQLEAEILQAVTVPTGSLVPRVSLESTYRDSGMANVQRESCFWKSWAVGRGWTHKAVFRG